MKLCDATLDRKIAAFDAEFDRWNCVPAMIGLSFAVVRRYEDGSTRTERKCASRVTAAGWLNTLRMRAAIQKAIDT